MKIKTVRIGHFGKLNNVEYHFDAGMNIIYGANESGKSTIHAFIKAMLFGIDKQRGRAAKEDVYTKYQPWNAPGEYYGSLDFEHEGKDYRLTRVFYQKEKKCVLSEIETGRKTDLPDGRITSMFPKLTLSSYNNTVSIGQQHIRTEAVLAEEVKNYLANMATSGDNEVDVVGALEELGKKRKDIASKIKGIDLDSLERRYRELLEAEEEQKLLSSDREEALSELNECLGRQSLMKEESGKSEIGEIKKLPGIIEKLNTKERLISEKYRTEASVAEYGAETQELDKEIEGLRKRLEQEKGAAGNSEIPGKREIPGTESNNPIISVKTEKTGGKIPTGLVITLIGIAICLAFGNRFRIGIICGVMVTIVGLVMVFLKLVAGRERRKPEKDIIDSTGRENICEDISREIGLLEGKRAGCVARSLELERRAAELTKEIGRIVEEVGEDYSEAEAKEVEERFDRLCQENEDRRQDENEIGRAIENCRLKLQRIESELEHLGDVGEAIESTEEELENAKTLYESLRTELEAAELAISTISELSESIHDNYGASISDALSGNVELLTAGKYTQARISPEFEPEIMIGTDFIPVSALSTGTVEQIYLALRLTIADLFFNKTEVPLLFDESFASFDDDRLKATLEALSRLQNRQLLIFTCRHREKELLDEGNIKYRYIRL